MFFERKYPLQYNIPYDGGSYGSTTSEVTRTEYKYVATDGIFVFTLGPKNHSFDFEKLKSEEPRIQLSHFEGCPHWYGVMFMPNGDSYELQCIINKNYLDNAHEMRGDWSGYKEGDATRRFLSKPMIMSAFNLLKTIVTQN